ncbi:MAG: GDSL-type esterase/lipase family protein [Streptococcaceae bacterium]|jgi:lysophospholipase L1-like esterase|nr:GDSL-type esterase/lipase family protein [Streptococcaceae bacterium]
MKVVIFGDSITNGYGIDGNLQTPILKDKLAQLTDAEISLYGHNGEDTFDALRWRPYIKEEAPDKVFIFFGANDAARNHAITPEDFAENLTHFIRAFGPEKTVLLTPPYHNDSVDAIFRNNQEIARYRLMTLQVARTFEPDGCQLIDITQRMQNAINPDTLLQADGLHFSEAGYDLLSAAIAEKCNPLTPV